ncbi:MAG: rhodanese-like domain-containing protein, partial [Planctomycetota bacterium]
SMSAFSVMIMLLFATAGAKLPVLPSAPPPVPVDMEGFLQTTAKVARYRQSRLVDLEAFLQLAKQADTVLLDTRSRDAYDRKHLEGAVHLNFSDFTAEKLAAVVPDKETTVLIYCNNNLRGDAENFPVKHRVLALNLPTFVNLYGYGYRHVYELNAYVSVDDARLSFAGTAVEGG